MRSILFLLFALCCTFSHAQENPNPLPRQLTESEQKIMELGLYQAPRISGRNFTNPPDFPTRTIGEWEELQSIIVTWDAFYSVLREIVRYAKEEVEVINVCEDSTAIKNYLESNNIDFDNLTFIQAPFNTVWVRDYGPNPVYQNDVDSLVLIDWIYNRPRPRDDVIPNVISAYLGTPLYSTTEAPNDLVHTGGNFMSDGLGMGFSSELILEENDSTNWFGTSAHTEEDIDSIVDVFMGIYEYPKMQSLLYDGINHIDMHMKLLDEQTLLVGEFPEGVSDGPRIEENIQYILDNYKTYWGTDFRIERIIQPPCRNGQYPPNCSASYEYRTYTNALFVNKTVLVPIYLTDTDSMALARWQELMPGHKIRGIDCRQIINSGGAIHCVTKEVGVNDPLWIAHRELDDVEAEENNSDYLVEAKIKHRSGIASAQVFWTIDTTGGYQSIDMSLENADEDIWTAAIPQQAGGLKIFYYIRATANSGKSIMRPIPAPAGYFSFETGELASNVEDISQAGISITKLYPNPASASTQLEIVSAQVEFIEVILTNVLGKTVSMVYQGNTQRGLNTYLIPTDALTPGTYFVQLKLNGGLMTRKLMVD